MENAKDFLACLVLACLIYLSVQLNFLVEDARTQLNTIAPKIETTAQNLSNSSTALAKSSIAFEKASTAQANAIADDKTLNQLAALVKKADRIMEHVDSILYQVDSQTISKTNSAIDQGTKTLQSADIFLVTANTSLGTLTDATAKDLEDIHNLLSDPKLQVVLANFVDTSESVKEITKDLQVTNQEIKENLPELIKELKNILANVDKGTLESSTFIAGLNKPLTKKQKLIKALIQIAFIAAPVAARR